MAKQNDTLEEILDELHDLTEKVGNRDADIQFIRQKLEAQTSPVAQHAPAPVPAKKEPERFNKSQELKDFIIECCKEGYQDARLDYFKEKSPLLLEADHEKIGDILKNKVAEIREEEAQTNLERKKQKQANDDAAFKAYKEKRKNQGMLSFEQVTEWAPEYPEAIQRWMRYVGLHLLDEDEPKEKIQALCKAVGDILVAASNQKPTLKGWLMYRWSIIKNYTNKRQWLLYFLYYTLGIFAICALCIYQNRVMEIHKANLIWRKTHVPTVEERRKLHEVDSILHSHDDFMRELWNSSR